MALWTCLRQVAHVADSVAVLGKEKKAWQRHAGFSWIYGCQNDDEKGDQKDD